MQSRNLENECNVAPLETYIHILADIFLTDKEYALFMFVVMTTGDLQTQGAPDAYHAYNYENLFLEPHKKIQKENLNSDLNFNSTELFQMVSHLIEIKFLTRLRQPNQLDPMRITVNTSFYFSLKEFLHVTYVGLKQGIEALEQEHKKCEPQKNAKYECNTCSKPFRTEDIIRFNISLSAPLNCPICRHGSLQKLKRNDSERNKYQKQEKMLAVLKEISKLSNRLIQNYKNNPNSLHNELKNMQQQYRDRIAKSIQMGYGNIHWTRNQGRLVGQNDKDISDSDENVQALLLVEGAGALAQPYRRRRKRRHGIINSSIDEKSVFKHRQGCFWRSEKLGGISLIGESARTPVWFADVVRRAKLILDKR
ncbi:hypothetical protein GMRT_11081 [Giardia muris]|uniref:Uncharacterized protein n=1 Tax=Giardia muris TaxID=5742 RepID=A0A4Z1T383_GIAMU|nr:hypothetical protein GMRT_11081 [Giardia muris]|eukprot:TNJ30118.1 hypothetical protein GMRT_11081 [Giardia muris]